MISKLLRRQGWGLWHVAAGLSLVALGVAVTFDAWADIFRIAFRDEESSHIFLVPVVAIWMAWVRRIRLRRCPPTGTFIGPVVIGVGWLLYTIGFNNANQSFWHAGAVLIVLGCLLSVVGKNVLLRFMPAFAVLVFLIPVPGVIREAIAVPLQTATAQTTQAILEIMGGAVDRSGNLLTINGVDVAVAEACNGLRMVFALVLVAYAFAYSMPLRNSVRLLVLAASPLAAIVCNVIRLLPTLLLYGYSSRGVADTFHSISGWIMLPVAFLMLLGIIRLLRWALIPVTRYTLAYQ